MAVQATSPAEVLAQAFGGELVDRTHESFDTLRSVYNSMIDRRPAMIARAGGVADVIAAIQYAKDEGLDVAVRSGGHSAAGSSVADDALLIDLAPMNGVRVDPKARTARAGGGTLWGKFDRETQVFGLATPGGRVTTTGVGGFTTGGGYAWISPKFGLTADNLISADVVTADGQVLVASEKENEDLFWGIRGGGGNFGVVTSFEFQLHPVGPMIVAGLLIWPLDEAREVMRAWRDFMDQAPDELSGAVAILPAAPPEEFIPAELHGQPVFGMIACWIGDFDQGMDAVQPLKDLQPAVDLLGTMPYIAFQAMLDPFAPRGLRNYWRGLHLKGLPDEAVDTFVDVAPVGLDMPTQMICFRHGGAVSRVPDDATAFSHREAAYMFHPIGTWPDPSRDDPHIDWVRRASEEMTPFTTGGVYLNFMADTDDAAVRAGYSPGKWQRLVELKDRYDPTNMFRFNQNIKPSGA
jgi:FAD/FMN-containing dehydrogenase